MLGQPVAQPVFRAMSTIQDDLDQTKYMYYRVITLLITFVLPFFVGLWWVAEPFVGVVYGENWLPAAEPLQILSLAGFFYIITRPSGVLLMAQNRLIKEIIAQAVILVFTLGACFIGLQWGLEGVSWGFLISQVFHAIYFYILVRQTIPTRTIDLFRAIAPGMQLNIILCIVLYVVDYFSGELLITNPAIYLLLMVSAGSSIYATLFLLLPIPALHSERVRIIKKITSILDALKGRLT